MAKKKDLSAYDIALDVFRVPVRKIADMIEDLDRFDLNKYTCVVTYYLILEESLAADVAKAVIQGYSPRFRACSIQYIGSAFDHKPIMTRYSFYTNSSWEGVRVISLGKEIGHEQSKDHLQAFFDRRSS